MDRKDIKNYLKKSIKEYMEKFGYESSPRLSILLEYYENELKKLIIEALEEIGKEKEKEGYKFIWNYDLDSGNDVLFFAIKYPNERKLTKKESEFITKYMIRTLGDYMKAIEYTYDLRTDGHRIWQWGLRERWCRNCKCWTWDEILLNIREAELFDGIKLFDDDELEDYLKELRKNNII